MYQDIFLFREDKGGRFDNWRPPATRSKARHRISGSKERKISTACPNSAGPRVQPHAPDGATKGLLPEATGRSPVSTSCKTTPKAKRSVALVGRSPRSSSGARYPGVPAMTPDPNKVFSA